MRSTAENESAKACPEIRARASLSVRRSELVAAVNGFRRTADGTPLAAQKLERVLTSDPGTGVIRHVDAGYEIAERTAEERGVRIPMREQ